MTRGAKRAMRPFRRDDESVATEWVEVQTGPATWFTPTAAPRTLVQPEAEHTSFYAEFASTGAGAVGACVVGAPPDGRGSRVVHERQRVVRRRVWGGPVVRPASSHAMS